jgi:DNA primase
MESFYELAFPDVDFNLSGETMVCCPFPHKTNTGEVYFETNPSMGINLDKGVHHCFSCGAKGNELQFIAQIMDIELEHASLLKDILKNANESPKDWEITQKTLNLNVDLYKTLTDKYKFSNAVIQELQIGIEGPGRGFAFPVFLFGRLVDVITYNPGHDLKYKKRYYSITGIPMPYDIWKTSKKHTCIVAGQKDMAIARSNSLNAIAITGGEGNDTGTIELFHKDFQNKTIYIIYDNDDTGHEGARKLAVRLKPYAKSIKIIDLSPICKEKGEDLWDFFVKYQKTKADLITIIQNTKEFSEEDYQEEKEKIYPTVSLKTATSTQYLNKILRSDIQVVAIDENKFLMPIAVEGKKIKAYGENEAKNTMTPGETRMWFFDNKRAKELFYLIDSNLKEDQIKKNLMALMRIPNEVGVAITNQTQIPVYKCTVTDCLEAFDVENMPEEYTAYVVKTKLESGKKYKITYKLIPHPFQGNALQMVIFNVEEGQDSISKFKLDTAKIQNLSLFQRHGLSLEDTMHNHIQKVKGLTNADYDDTLLTIIDLCFHTPLMFNLGNIKNLSACLDTLVIAESRVGKTSTVIALQQTYNVGTRIPLNGHNSSIAGLIGGSYKTRNGFQTRAGLIPRSHGNIVILEELTKAKQDLLKEFTELRSSHMASITRVSGTVTLPAFVRMLTLTNPRAQGAIPKPISSYPNGIELVIDLVGTAEDIARYDVIGVLPDKGAKKIDPFFTPEKAFPIDAYQDRLRWIWSRKPEQIKISKEIYVYTVQKANKLNETYDSYIKIFGTEAHIKILRVAIALAGYTVSTNETFDEIIVLQEHIDYAATFLVNLYDNSTFRFRQYVEAEHKYRTVDDAGIKVIQELWQENSTLLSHLENYSTTQQKTLQQVCSVDQTTFNAIMSTLITNLFVRFDGYEIVPTERFRRTMAKIDRTINTRYIRL